MSTNGGGGGGGAVAGNNGNSDNDVASKTLGGPICPPEVALLIDFVADDHRPTLLFERRSRHQNASADMETDLDLVVRNAAFEALMKEEDGRGVTREKETEFAAWVNGMDNDDKENVFAGKSWVKKILGKSGKWVAVVCRGEVSVSRHRNMDHQEEKTKTMGRYQEETDTMHQAPEAPGQQIREQEIGKEREREPRSATRDRLASVTATSTVGRKDRDAKLRQSHEHEHEHGGGHSFSNTATSKSRQDNQATPQHAPSTIIMPEHTTSYLSHVTTPPSPPPSIQVWKPSESNETQSNVINDHTTRNINSNEVLPDMGTSAEMEDYISKDRPAQDRPAPPVSHKVPELDNMIVDWLRFPHLTPDPWINTLRAHDWSQTDIGPMHTWHPTLHQMYSTILSSTEPRILYWGNNLKMFYNEAARFVVGDMHPAPLGNTLASVWGEDMLHHLGGIITTGIKQGKPVHNRRREFLVTRNGFPERAIFHFVLLPIPGEDGRFLGFYNEFVEITDSVVQENRHEVSRTIIENASRGTDLAGLWTGFSEALEGRSMDVSYALVYSPDNADLNATLTENANDLSEVRPFQLRASFGIKGHPLGSTISPSLVAALQNRAEEIAVLQSSNNTLPDDLAINIQNIGPVRTVCVMPITSINNQNLAYVVLGISPTGLFDENSRQFVISLRDLLFKSAAIFSLPIEQRRIQAITSSLSQQLQSATAKAEKSEENFTRMVQDAPIGMCMYRPDGFPLYVNDVYLDLIGSARNEFYECANRGEVAWRKTIFSEDLPMVEAAWTAAMTEQKAFHTEFRVNTTFSNTSPNRGRWLEATTQLHFDEHGNTVFLYGWVVDISARKLTESLVAERLRDALETKRSSENFIDMVSHEMRNPLSSILQLADAVLMSVPDEEECSTFPPESRATLIDAAQTITLCAKHQKNIIDEVLTFSKLDSKLLVLSLERVQPPSIVESALKMVKAELEHADIEGSIKIHQNYIDLGVDHVLLDPGRLLQVIINLLTNAIKFTQNAPERRITIHLNALPYRPTAKDCTATLIAPRREENEEDAQSQAVSSYSGPVGEEVFICVSVKDTGIGLTDEEMKHLFHRFSQASPKTYKQYGGSGLGLFISRELTELQGGQIGVFSESGVGSEFALYVKALRVEPPALDTLSLPSRTQSRSPRATSPRLSPRLATSAVGVENARMAKLTNDIQNLSKSTPPITPPPPPIEEAPSIEVQDLHVLVVEDNAINQKVMAQQLRKVGCATVNVADHGLDALNFLSTTNFYQSSSDQAAPLSVVLLDVEMPVMDGLTCARRIRQLQKEGRVVAHVPVIGITANARSEQVAACIEAGMDEVITKPFRMQQLVPRMQALVAKYMDVG